MAKKSGGKSNAKKAGGNKPKKAGMFKALKKQEKRTVVVEKDTGKKKVKAKRPAAVSDEFRNFDERMAAQRSRRPGTAANGPPKVAAVAPPTFVMAAPTFQFNANPVQAPPPPREVEGFHGFLSAMQAPKDAPAVNPSQQQRPSKPMQPEYRGNNVFNVLDSGDEEQQPQQAVAQPPPSFLQPATFTFASAKPTFTLPQPVAVTSTSGEDIDPDL